MKILFHSAHMGLSSKEKSKHLGYVDPTGELSNKDLALSSWFVRRKILLRKIFIALLLAWAILGGLFSLIMWGAYLFSGYWKDRDTRLQTVQRFENYTEMQSAYGAQNLQISDSQIFQSGEKYDFYAMAINPNTDFLARVRYKYVFEGGETPLKTITLSPGKKLPLVIYGFETAGYPSGARLQIEETLWRKIDPHAIPDIKSYVESRSHFLLQNLAIERNSVDVPARIAFDITNDTAYSYYEGRFAVVLLSGTSVEGILPLSIKNFRAAETFPIDIRPSFDISSISDVEILPLMDLFDSSEFLPAFK